MCFQKQIVLSNWCNGVLSKIITFTQAKNPEGSGELTKMVVLRIVSSPKMYSELIVSSTVTFVSGIVSNPRTIVTTYECFRVSVSGRKNAFLPSFPRRRARGECLELNRVRPHSAVRTRSDRLKFETIAA